MAVRRARPVAEHEAQYAHMPRRHAGIPPSAELFAPIEHPPLLTGYAPICSIVVIVIRDLIDVDIGRVLVFDHGLYTRNVATNAASPAATRFTRDEDTPAAATMNNTNARISRN